MTIKPRQPAPVLEVETVGGDRWSLAAQKPEHFTMIVIYRGLHCPICRKYLSELDSTAEEFRKRGVSILVASTDSKARAEEAKSEWVLPNLTVGYGVPIEIARQWGLYISAGRGPTSAGVEEPAFFAEPGLFLAKPDGTLYWGSTSTMPFARPHFSEILQAIDFVIAKNYPARGES